MILRPSVHVELNNQITRPKFSFRFLGKLPATNIFQLEFVVKVKDENGAVSDVGSNAVKYIVGMHERLALGAGGQDRTILAEVVELAALLDGRVVVEGNSDGGVRGILVGVLVGVVLEESVAICASVHVTDHDRLERNASPDNFFVKIKQGVEFILVVKHKCSATGKRAMYM